MKKHIAILALTLFAALGSIVHAQTPAPTAPEFLVADGSSSGTYAQFLKEISAYTADVVTFKEVPSSGAVENLDLLINNKASGAFMHSDVIQFRSQTTDLSKFKTLIALFSEEVHFLALAQSKRTTGGTLGFNKQVVTIRDVEDLKGLRVGAAGGGYVTAQVINLQAQLHYDIIQYAKGADVLDALNRGEIDAAVFVGGAPLPNLVDLGPQYKFLPIPDRDVQLLKSVYHPATITYNKMSATSVNTVAADCLFIAREYTKTPRLIALLRSFRDTFYAHLGELQETPGLHPKWKEVSADNHGKWPYMDLGAPTGIAVAK